MKKNAKQTATEKYQHLRNYKNINVIVVNKQDQAGKQRIGLNQTRYQKPQKRVWMLY